jgi:hypothetical protein
MVSVARQIGNAVPPGMAKALAEQVKAHLSGDYAVEGAHAGQLELVAG